MRDWAQPLTEGLAAPSIAVEASGRGVRLAVIDTGVNFDHPHLGQAPCGHGEFRDHFGHGTCCAALVHLLAPDAELFAVRVTNERGTTDAVHLARGIRLAEESGASILLVALGTEAGDRRAIDEAVFSASAKGAIVVAADPRALGRSVVPAESPEALGVGHFDGVDVAKTVEGAIVAEGRARPPRPGVGRAPGNFWGASLAAARAAAALARWSELSGERGEALKRGFKKALVVL
jgi:hypothetical protein